MLSVSSKTSSSGGGKEAGIGAGERGGVRERSRNTGSFSSRDVTRSSRSIRASSSAAGHWAPIGPSASVPDDND